MRKPNSIRKYVVITLAVVVVFIAVVMSLPAGALAQMTYGGNLPGATYFNYPGNYYGHYYGGYNYNYNYNSYYPNYYHHYYSQPYAYYHYPTYSYTPYYYNHYYHRW